MSTLRRWLLLVLLIACTAGCSGKKEDGQTEQPASSNGQTTESAVEMEDYILGMIKKGAAWMAEETAEVAALQEQHLARIEHLADSGVLVLAGPFIGEFRDENTPGILIYRVDSLAQARRLARSDPAVQEGRLKIDLFRWRAPADLTYDENYEMMEYYLSFYFKGPFFYAPETPPSFPEMLQAQTAQLPAICDSCRIALAGEFTDSENSYALTGMIIYQVYTREQADRIIADSPAMRASHYIARLFDWYGPSGLRMEE